jgi:glycosyltransferase involved in cell wall biosynthesis
MPLTLSVVVPCRNRAEYLRATLDSILQQDYPHIECIVIDAESTDGTLDILQSYGDRIRWVSEPDAGHADAINKGWRLARGDVLAWLNADDVYVVPDGVSRAMAQLEAHADVDVLYGDCGAIDADGRHIGYSYLRPWSLDAALTHCDNCIPQPAAFIRRRILDRVDMLDTAFHQKKDHELWLRIATQGGVIRHVPQLFAHARAIKGLSFDGRTAAPACVQLVRRYTRDRRAISNAYLRGIDYAWAGGRLWGIIVQYAVRAAAVDPSNAAAVWAKVRSLLRRRRASPSSSRAVEVAWLLAHLPEGDGEALVVEPDDSDLALTTALRGWRTLAVAPRHEAWGFHHPRLRFLRGTLRDVDHPAAFDLVVARSLDDEAAARRLLRPGGRLIRTSGHPGEAAWRRGDDGKWVSCEPARGDRFGSIA